MKKPPDAAGGFFLLLPAFGKPVPNGLHLPGQLRGILNLYSFVQGAGAFLRNLDFNGTLGKGPDNTGPGCTHLPKDIRSPFHGASAIRSPGYPHVHQASPAPVWRWLNSVDSWVSKVGSEKKLDPSGSRWIME